MFELCLEGLISGVIALNGMNLAVDHNNDTIYDYSKKTNYVLVDKYSNIELCKDYQTFANVNITDDETFNFINTID